ncbi:MAG: AMP-binding protein [Panacagrimonas sp.]
MSQQTILSRLYHWEKTTPNDLHFVQPIGAGKVQQLSWAQCMDQTRRMAAHLKSLDFPAGSQIALLAKNSAHWMMADWAIWMAGHVSVPIYPTLNAESVRYILEHSEARLLFVGKLDDWDDMKPGVADDLPGITLPMAPDTQYPQWDDIMANTEPMPGEPERDPQEMATIVYTSGSTGKPKGVMHSFKAFEIVAGASKRLLGVTPADRALSYLPLAHVIERALIETPSCFFGNQVYFTESLETFPQDLRRAKPTVFMSVPRLWCKFESAVNAKIPEKRQKLLFRIPVVSKIFKKKILEQLGLEHARFAGTGSAPLPAVTLDWYRSLGLELLEGYGMSEDFAYSHMSEPGAVRVGYVGVPQDGVETRIAENGEILIKSPGCMMGYFKEPEKTKAAFTDDGFFKTGDMGEYDDENRLKITGRIKELFKTSKGKYVAPVPIENKLNTHPEIEAVCVGGANQPATFGLVMLAEEARTALNDNHRNALGEELKALMNQTNAGLDPHEQMKFLVIVGETWSIANGFLTPTMKIKRNIIEDHYASKIDDWFAQKKTIIWEL